jgi:phosphodiesterase/alkaline phosphatase D-like protein
MQNDRRISLKGLLASAAAIWARASNDAADTVEYSIDSDFKNARHAAPQRAFAGNDYVGRFDIGGLEPATRFF